MQQTNDLEVISLTYHSRLVKKTKDGGRGCPKCGQKIILHFPSGKATYGCGYSSGAKGETPCKNS